VIGINVKCSLSNYFSSFLFVSIKFRDEGITLTQAWVLRNLVKLGFKEKEAEVYVFLTIHKSQTAKKIAYTLKMNPRQVYRILKILQKKSIINSSSNRPTVYSAETIEQALGMLLADKKEQANALTDKRTELLMGWRLITDNKKVD
jgi:sugar-specific transcriptional regulator TrmB